jgi:hypothetical protein
MSGGLAEADLRYHRPKAIFGFPRISDQSWYQAGTNQLASNGRKFLCLNTAPKV